MANNTADSLLPSWLASRREQLFPQLTEAEIARIGAFGTVRRYAQGERLLVAGELSPGMFVVLKSMVRTTLRGGLGHMVPFASRTRAQFLGEVSTLSGRAFACSAPAAASVAAT